MKKFALPIGVLVAVLMVVAVQQGWAQDQPSNKIGEALSLQLYCQTQFLLEGDIGLLLGLILMFGALWAMVQGAKIMQVLPLIIIGGLMTALPSLVEATLSGLGNLIQQSGMSKQGFKPPNCSTGASGGASTPSGDSTSGGTASTTTQSGTFLPGVYHR